MKEKTYEATDEPQNNTSNQDDTADTSSMGLAEASKNLDSIPENSDKGPENADLADTSYDKAEKLYDSSNQELLSFDEALERVRDTENLNSQQNLVYIGTGHFAIFERKQLRGKRKKLMLIKKILFEEKTEHTKISPARLVPPSYSPEGVQMSSLYTDEEISRFPDFS